MATALLWLGGLAATAAAATVAFNVAAYAAAARVREAPDCPFEGDQPASWTVRAHAFARECAAMLLIVLPFGALPRAPRRGVAGSAVPVLLLPGYAVPAAGVRRLARRLRRDGWRVHALGLGWGHDLTDRAARLERGIARLRATTAAGTVDVVAFGLDGLVVRSHVRRHGAASGIRRLVTLGTPHRGTAAFPASRLRAFARVRPGAPVMAELGEPDPVPDLIDVIALHSTGDALVVPADNAYYPGAFNIRLRDVGHFSLLRSRRVYDLVRENLAADAPAAQRSAS